MKKKKNKNKPTFEIEFNNFNVKELIYSSIIMSSIFLWDSQYKNPYSDRELGYLLDTLQKYVDKNYKERKDV